MSGGMLSDFAAFFLLWLSHMLASYVPCVFGQAGHASSIYQIRRRKMQSGSGSTPFATWQSVMDIPTGTNVVKWTS